MLLLFYFEVQTTSTTPVSNPCTSEEGMKNPALTPVVIVNGNKNSEALRPDINGQPLIVKDKTVTIEVGFGIETELGSTKFLNPSDNNVGTFQILLVVEEGKPPVPYKNGEVCILYCLCVPFCLIFISTIVRIIVYRHWSFVIQPSITICDTLWNSIILASL